MKKWNGPVVEELDVTMTASGCAGWKKETCLTHPVGDNEEKDDSYTPS